MLHRSLALLLFLCGFSEVTSGVNDGGHQMTSSWTLDPFSRIEAENFTAQSGNTVQPSEDPQDPLGLQVSQLKVGEWLEYSDVNFMDGAELIQIRMSSALAEGVKGGIDLRVDSPTRTPVASLTILSTGGSANYVTHNETLSVTINGVHNLYLTFTGSNPGDAICNINWFKFTPLQ